MTYELVDRIGEKAALSPIGKPVALFPPLDPRMPWRVAEHRFDVGVWPPVWKLGCNAMNQRMAKSYPRHGSERVVHPLRQWRLLFRGKGPRGGRKMVTLSVVTKLPMGFLWVAVGWRRRMGARRQVETRGARAMAAGSTRRDVRYNGFPDCLSNLSTRV